jgi:hypothetical protein
VPYRRLPKLEPIFITHSSLSICICLASSYLSSHTHWATDLFPLLLFTLALRVQPAKSRTALFLIEIKALWLPSIKWRAEKWTHANLFYKNHAISCSIFWIYFYFICWAHRKGPVPWTSRTPSADLIPM